MSTSSNINKLLRKIQRTYPDITFVASDTFAWSPNNATILFDPTANDSHSQWALIHELGHALLNHQDYQSDLELLILEAAAWEKALQIAPDLGIVLSESHVQDCLDTYRDWLHNRSLCPTCEQIGIQGKRSTYSCINCSASWNVSQSRFCRPYRKKTK